ncbi:MAG: hypothetical protein HZB67_03810, partial [Candidatus Aenigmarchaeota archaeon]|nr:hypothetical protein [Candidatus Aenigmarchaeota archaeon]
MIKTSAPGKVILFGEHAVVYGKLGIATAIDIRVQSQIEKSKSIIVENIGTFRITPEQLEEINIAVSTLINKHNFSLLSSMLKDDQNLCTKYIISEIVKNIEPEPFKLKNTSTLRKGMGGSSAAFSAEIKALAEFYGLRNFTRKKISELAYKGDIIAHGGTPSGIDNSTVTFGGYIAFRKETGPEMLDIESKMRIVIGDTKRPANTGQTVSMVRSRVEKGDRKAIAAIDDIDEISSRALDTIKSQDLVKLG